MTAQAQARCWGKRPLGGFDSASAVLGSTIMGGGFIATQDVTSIALGEDHVCLLSKAGIVLCGGQNSDAQLGNDTTVTTATDAPKPVAGLSKVKKIITSHSSTMAFVAVDGVKTDVYRWGHDNTEKLATIFMTPEPFFSGVDLSKEDYFLEQYFRADLVSGKVFMKGDNSWGQMGKGATSDYETGWLPLSSIGGISLGPDNVCAWESGGRLWCWGRNEEGTVGNGETASSVNSPTLVKW
ncbi:MAG: hypothetical protein EOO74_10810 [Myxococcales bacterium]|nr:MAG: hypothetical protein EOO74_10810 [Myxococcales bacterium]